MLGNLAVEVKAKRIVGKRDMRGLVALPEEDLFDHYIVVGMESTPRAVDGIRIMPRATFLRVVAQVDDTLTERKPRRQWKLALSHVAMSAISCGQTS